MFILCLPGQFRGALTSVSSWKPVQGVGTAESLSLLPTPGTLEPGEEPASTLQASRAPWEQGESESPYGSIYRVLGRPQGSCSTPVELEWKSGHEHSNFVAGKDLGSGFSKL